MLNRSTITFLFIAVLLNTSAFADQAKDSLKKVGFLASQNLMFLSREVPVYLENSGFYQQKNIVYQRKAAIFIDELAELANELVTESVDIIVTDNEAAAAAAQQATQSIPIVMIAFNNPVKAGLVNDLTQPGGNITGLMIPMDEIIGKQFDLLQEIIPDLKQVGVFWNPTNPVNRATWETTQAIAAKQGITLTSLEISIETDPKLEAALETNCQALLAIEDRSVVQNTKSINEFATTHRLPVIYPHQSYTNFFGNGLISYGADFVDLGIRTAVFVEKILNGTNPGNLPVEHSSRFLLYVNLKTANAMDLKIPDSILSLADKVIE